MAAFANDGSGYGVTLVSTNALRSVAKIDARADHSQIVIQVRIAQF
jgi:hypothetical protein